MLYTLELLPILIFTFAYALNFINSRFGSLFWLLEVPIGSLFHKKNGSLLGPYLKAKGSLIVLGTVPSPPLTELWGTQNRQKKLMFSCILGCSK